MAWMRAAAARAAGPQRRRRGGSAGRRPDIHAAAPPEHAAGAVAGPPKVDGKSQERPVPYELHMRLENCHGIGRLDHTLRFPDKKQHMAIYASNGTMKTSLAKTLKAVARDDPASPPPGHHLS